MWKSKSTKPTPYRLNISEYCCNLTIPWNGQIINPWEYYVTFGDAITKTRYLRHELSSLITEIYKHPHSRHLKEFATLVHRQLDNLDGLLLVLSQIKETYIHLESEILRDDNGHKYISCRPVNPRGHKHVNIIKTLN